MEQQRKLLNQRRREKVNLGFHYLTGWDIEDIFITECIKDDISNGGTLNLENREVIRDYFETFCKKNNIDLDRHGVGTSKVQMAINPYRYRKILWYYDKNYPKYLTIQQTGFSQSMVYKVYGNPEQYRKIVNETIKEEKQNAETKQL
jgi:hypothetical protein